MSHGITLALVAVVSCGLAVVGFVVSASLDVFAPCRLVYRTQQSVQGSLACQSYAAINLSAVLFVLAALVLGIVVTVRALLRRRAGSMNASHESSGEG